MKSVIVVLYPLISSLSIIMGKYYGCQKEMIQIMAICEVTDGKVDTLFIYDRKVSVSSISILILKF